MKTSTSASFLHNLPALLCAALLPAFFAPTVWAQTAPTAQTLPYTQNFGTATFTTSPAGVAVWNGVSGGSVNSQALAEGSAPTGNATLTAATAAQTTGAAYGYAAGGNAQLYIQTSSNASNGVNQPVVAVDTTGRQNIVLSYDISVISAQPRTVGVVAQYRVGTSGAWTTITPSSGSNPFSQAGGTTGLKTTVSATLPAAADNQPVVQIRWAIWRGTETGSSSGIGLDNISLTGDPTSTGPLITSFTPASGFAGDTVTINGFNFGATPAVRFNGVAAASSVNGAGTQITATVPNEATTGKITVEVVGQDTATSAADFAVLVPGTPTVNLSTNAISGLSTSTGVASAATNYVVTGVNLGSTAITITPSVPFLQVGTNGTDFADTIELSPNGGTVSNTVFLRVAATNVVTNYAGTVAHISGTASNSLAVSGSITNLPPSIVLNPTNLAGFAATVEAPSASQAFTVTGSSLTNDVTFSAPTGFEIASDAATWTNTLLLSQAGGSASGTISVRMAATNVFGPRSGSVTAVSTGLTNRVNLSGSIPVPNVPGQVYWSFDTATPTSGTGGDYAAWTFGPITQNNNNGTTPLLNTTSASAGYTNPFNVLASGTTNAGAAARTGAFDAASNAFFEVQIVVPSNTTTSITNISFGSRSTGTGPAAYSIRSSMDGFAADVFTNTLTTNSTWAMQVAPVAIALSNGSNTLRIYGFNGAGNPTAGTANWRIDDLTLALAPSPLITLTGPEFTQFETTVGTPSVVQSVDVSGSNLTGDVVITAPAGFAVSKDGSNFASSVSLTPTDGSLSDWSILLMLTGDTEGSYSGNLTFQSPGAATQMRAVSGTVSSVAVPTIQVTGSFTSFSTTVGTPSEAQSVSVTGSTLNTGIIIVADTTPEAFEISTDGVTYQRGFVSLDQTEGTVAATTVFVRLAGSSVAGSSVGSFSGNLKFESTGATTQNLPISGTVGKGTPVITAPPTATPLVQGDNLGSSLLTGGSVTIGGNFIAGSFAWNDSSIIPPVGTTSYDVTFTPSDAANYNTATTNASVTVLSAYEAGYSNWLTEFQLDPQATTGPTAGAPNADPDGDGFSNASEYAFGTNPTVPNGALLTTTSSNSIFRSSWAGPASGVTYGVQFSTNLSTMAFSNDPTITIESVGGVMSFTNQATGNKFFRVRATSN